MTRSGEGMELTPSSEDDIEDRIHDEFTQWKQETKDHGGFQDQDCQFIPWDYGSLYGHHGNEIYESTQTDMGNGEDSLDKLIHT